MGEGSLLPRKNKYLTNKKARELTGITQRDKMTQTLKNWVSKGVLIQIKPPSGYVKATKYMLPEAAELGR